MAASRAKRPASESLIEIEKRAKCRTLRNQLPGSCIRSFLISAHWTRIGSCRIHLLLSSNTTSHHGFRNDIVASQIHLREFTARDRAAVSFFKYRNISHSPPFAVSQGTFQDRATTATPGRETAPVKISGPRFGRPKPRMERPRDLDKR
eukprot:6212047-Pleurochrysis_carterae.AAC.1